MNLREGTGRLALLLGAVGALFCGLVSFALLQSSLRQRADHIRFAQITSRIEQLGKETQNEYPVYRDIDSGKLGWAVLVKYPQYWGWVTGQTMQEPSWPKSWEIHGAEQGPRSDSWEDIRNQDDWRIWGIKTPDGRTVYPVSAPGAGSYFLIVILPFLGFFIPWGVVRAIGWVVIGFAQPST